MHENHLHATAQELLSAHDQSSWAMTPDGLICAPIGFARFLQQANKDPSEAAKTAAFAFRAEDLDIVPHPDDPTRKILKKPAYILDPLNAIEATVLGALQRKIEDHQGKWLLFVWRYGNLYYTDRRQEGQGEYYSNNFIAYRFFPERGANGDITKYHVSYRVDPDNKDYGFGLDQGAPWHSFARHGIELGAFATRDETLGFIHRDFCERYQAFVEGREVLRWSDPDILHNVGMWGYNFASHLVRQPLSIGSAATKLIDFALKLSPAGIMFGVWIDRLERRAEQALEEARGSELKDIAEVEDAADRPVPLYPMKEEARRHWVVIDNPQPPLLRAPLPPCDDLEAHERRRMIDIINGYQPVMVRQYDSEVPHFCMAREAHGMQIFIVCEGDDASRSSKRYITYAKGRAATGQAGLPANLKPLFSQDENLIACIERRSTATPLADGETIFHQPSNDDAYHDVHFFVRKESVIPSLSAPAAEALARHTKPEFLPANQNEMSPQPEPLSAFGRCKEILFRYGSAALPTTTEGFKNCIHIYTVFAAGAVAAFAPQGHIITPDIRSSAPLLFSVAAALLTKHIGKKCLTPRGATTFNVAASAILSFGFSTFAYKTGGEILATYVHNGLSHNGLLRSLTDQDTDEKICGTAGALFLGIPFGVNAIRVGLRALWGNKPHAPVAQPP